MRLFKKLQNPFSLRTGRTNMPLLKKAGFLSRQDGSVLLGLVITMVIMGILGAHMVYLTTSSTFHELQANYTTRALYAAESGGRYVNAQIREALTTGSPSLTSLASSLNNSTFSMANNEQFQITNFGSALVNSSWQFAYDSTGFAGSGFLTAKKKLSYTINPSYQGGISPPPPMPRDASTFDVPKQDLDIYYSPVDMSEVDIKDNPTVDGDRALNLKSADYTMGLRWYNASDVAQLDAIRENNGGYLSYGAQVQIYDYDEETPQASLYNIMGLSFRLDDDNDDGNTLNDIDNMYGFSIVKLTKLETDSGPAYIQAPDWYKDHIYNVISSPWDVFSTGPDDPNSGKWFVVLWKRITTAGSTTYTPLAYQKITASDVVCDDGTETDCDELKDWVTLVVYVYETASGNDIRAYLASPPSYPRSTTASPQTIRWPEQDGVPDAAEVPSRFKTIDWTLIDSSGITSDSITLSDGTEVETLHDSSLDTSNYDSYVIGNLSGTKAREIGLHIFNTSTSAQNIFYDNFFIDLGPSGYGYVDGSGQVIIYP